VSAGGNLSEGVVSPPTRSGSGTPTATEVSGVIKRLFFKVNPLGFTVQVGMAWLIRRPLCGKDDRTLRALEASLVHAVIPGDAQSYPVAHKPSYIYGSKQRDLRKIELFLPHGPDTKKSTTPASRASATGLYLSVRTANTASLSSRINSPWGFAFGGRARA
jgi:hypothetical protein